MKGKTKGLLTIIVPCYNGEAYIQRCTQSLSGLRDDISVLFVNDGSADSSVQMIEEWMSTHPNAYLITKTNGGYATAINCGLDACGTEYVMFLGVDDEVIVDGIHQVTDHLRKNRPDILAFTTIKRYDDREGEQAQEKDFFTVYSKNEYFETDLFSLYNEHKKDARILFVRDTSRCFKMSCIGDTRYFGKFGVSADGCFSMIVASGAKSFEFLNADGYIWHLHADSVSARKKSKKGLLDEAIVWDAFYRHFQNHFPDIPMPKPIIAYAYEYWKVIYMLSKEDRKCTREYAKRTREVLRWLLRHPMPFGWRLKLLFPGLYRLWLRVKLGQ